MARRGHQISVSNNLPEGCILSPVVFNIYTSLLHEKCSNKMETIQYEDDDFLIIATGDFMEEIEDISRQQVDPYIKQCTTLKLPVNFEKSCIIVFSRACMDVLRLNIKNVLEHKTISFLKRTILASLAVKDETESTMNKVKKAAEVINSATSR